MGVILVFHWLLEDCDVRLFPSSVFCPYLTFERFVGIDQITNRFRPYGQRKKKKIDFSIWPPLSVNDTQPIEIEVTKLIDIKEAADRLDVSADQIRGFIADGDIEYVDVSRSGSRHREVRFTSTMIVDFIERRSRRNAKINSIKQTKLVARSRGSATLSRPTDQGITARLQALIEGNM